MSQPSMRLVEHGDEITVRRSRATGEVNRGRFPYRDLLGQVFTSAQIKWTHRDHWARGCRPVVPQGAPSVAQRPPALGFRKVWALGRRAARTSARTLALPSAI